MLLLGAVALAQTALPDEEWLIMSLSGTRVGYSHTWYVEENGQYVTTEHEEMSVQRMGSTMKSVADEVYRESPEGLPLSFNYESKAGSHEVVNGTIAGGKVRAEVRRGGQMSERTFDLDPEVRFPVASDRAINQRQLATGLKFTEKSLSLSSLTVHSTEYEVLGPDTLAGKPVWKVRCISKGTGGFQQTLWVDDHWNTQKMEFLGIPMKAERATKEQALAATDKPSDDVLSASGLPCDVLILRPRSTSEMAVRVKSKTGNLKDLSFASDYATLEPSGPDAVTVRVKPPALSGEATTDVDPEYLAPNDFLHCQDPKIVETAKRVAGSATGAEAVIKLRNWVATRVAAGGEVAFATDLEALNSGRGDCTERAVLLASLTRALGIPSKVIYGFAYSHGNYIGHAWTEVRLAGQWIPVDAALLRLDSDRQIDAGHLKMAETSLKDGNPDSRGMMGAFGRLETELVDYAVNGTVVPASGLKATSSGRSWSFPGLGVSLDLPSGWSLIPAAGGADMLLKGPDAASVTLSCMEKGRDFMQSDRTIFARGEPTRLAGLPGRKFLRGDKMLVVLDRGDTAVVVVGNHMTSKAQQEALKFLGEAQFKEP